MKKRIFSLMQLFLLASFVLLAGCTASKTTAEKGSMNKVDMQANAACIGTWAYVVKGTPDGDTAGEMTFSMNGNILKGVIATGGSQTDIQDLKIVNNLLTGTFYYNGMTISMNGTFTGNSYDGKVDASGYTFPMTATRK